MTPGLLDIPATEYHADPCPTPSLSSGLAKVLIGKSPKHAWLAHPKLNPNYRERFNGDFDLGTAAHAALLEGNRAKICVIDAADWRTNAAKEKRDEAYANGLTPILAKHNVAVTRMVDAAKAYVERTELKGIFQDGEPEQVIVWQEDGLWFRAMMDWLKTDRSIIIDYKTTEDASPDTFSRQISRMQYDFQRSFYLRGMRALGYDPEFLFLAQETGGAHECTLHGVSPALEAYADFQVERAIQLWRKCLESDEWPGYPTQVCWATPTNWQMAEMERQMNEGENNGI